MARVLCLGHAVQDYVFTLPALPSAGVKYRATGFECVGGGPAATGAVAIARLGGEAQLITRLGDDGTGDAILEELDGYGVDIALSKKFHGVASSLSAVIVDAHGERMIINYRNHDLPSATDWLDEDPVMDAIAKAYAVLADIRWPEGAAKVLASAKNKGKPAILDIDGTSRADEALLMSATHLAFAADSACAHAKTDNLRDAIRTLAEQTGAWVCATDGAAGAYYCDGKSSAPDVSPEIDHAPSFPTTPVDTLGAGDVWHGAFALRLADKAPEDEAVRFANAAAAIKVSRPGGRKGAPSLDDVNALLRSDGQLTPIHPSMKERAS